jgi:hypothetical protein
VQASIVKRVENRKCCLLDRTIHQIGKGHDYRNSDTESPRWDAFIEQLNAVLAEDGCAGDASDDTDCHAKAVMRDMGGVDIESSLDYFENHGGYCDCEIILNVATGDEKCLNDRDKVFRIS